MKKLIGVLLVTFLGAFWSLNAQNLTGDWNGELEVQGMKLPLVFHITKNDQTLLTTLDSPLQGAKDIPTGSTLQINDSIYVLIPALGAKYAGKLQEDKLIGIFSQGGLTLPLTLSRGSASKAFNRPQEPKEPFPYLVEEVTFKNLKANNITFGGTLTLPKNVNNPPVAILISGSGGQNRDEELLGHKPFLVIADYLTRKGIAVLRYDDRGIASSEAYVPAGFKDNTTLDFALDAEAAFDYLKTRKDAVDIQKIGFIGHSEGGLIAPIVALQRKDVAFCILLAGPGVNGTEVLITQARRNGELSGENPEFIEINEAYTKKIYEIIHAKPEDEKVKLKVLFKELLDKYPGSMEGVTEKTIDAQIASLTSDWMRTFMKLEPADYLTKVQCPVLAINGEKDFQVLPKINLPGIEQALKKGKNKDFTIKELPNLNHLFQNSQTGTFSEYGQIEETISPIALELMFNWLKARF
ncbi:MAG: alpha/beta hydrolase [Saprospiraceae bacterium]|nr:alpha/beta hydrolase [Saprospiraceae bacterium]